MKDAMAYDPLRAALPQQSLDYPDTYWRATAGVPPADDGPLQIERDVDVAIIGAGYTGLSCAYQLAHWFGATPCVLEAHRPGWGCSGRNGSFARPALGRLSYQQWINKWGSAQAKNVFRESLQALSTVRDMIRVGEIDCDAQADGWLKIAHRKEKIQALAKEQRLLSDVFGYRVDFLGQDEIRVNHFIGGEAFAALRFPEAFAMHPLKFAYGLLRMARQAGAVVHSSSPVIGWRKEGERHLLETPGGTVRARQVIIATNGYSTEQLHPVLSGRLMPVLSNVIVTRAMTQSELEACRLRSTDVMTDTRNILNYYRRLPDGRLLLGSRGPIVENSQSDHRHQAMLLETLRRKFPDLENISVEYAWGGWVALTLDMLPHIHHVEDDPSVWYAIGYNGSGVSAAVYAGKRLADRLAGAQPLFPSLYTPLPRIPLAGFRRLAQRALFAWYRQQDER